MQAARADRASLFLSCPLGIFGLCLNWLILYSPASLLAVGKKKNKMGRREKRKNKENPGMKTWVQQAKKLGGKSVLLHHHPDNKRGKNAGIYQR